MNMFCVGDAMDERGQLKVNETLQVQDHPDVFAIGDCCNFEKDKLASLAMYSHAPLMLENLKLRQAKKTLKKCKPSEVPLRVFKQCSLHFLIRIGLIR